MTLKAIVKRILRSVIYTDRVEESKKPPEIMDDLSILSGGEVTTVFDIGAHHGNYALRLSAKIKSQKYYCFEPFPPSFEILKQKLNGEEFYLEPGALSDFDGVSDFYSNNFDETNSLLKAAQTNSHIDHLISSKEVIKVSVQTLDGFCQKEAIEKIDILKIDAQGSTLSILNGAQKMLEKGAVKIIQCEAEFIEIYSGEGLYHNIASFLEQFGYSLYSIYNLHYDINNRLSWGDALFIKNDRTN